MKAVEDHIISQITRFKYFGSVIKNNLEIERCTSYNSTWAIEMYEDLQDFMGHKSSGQSKGKFLSNKGNTKSNKGST